jgi:hypothetical protein
MQAVLCERCFHTKADLSVQASSASVHSNGSIMVHLQPLDRLRLQRGAEHLQRLGARAQAEFLAELAGRIGGMPAIQALLAEYSQLTPTTMRRAGGDRFRPRVLRQVAS